MGALVQIPPGARFGRWEVVGEARNHGRSWCYPCRCDCGQERDVDGRRLRRGHSLSCGCSRAVSPARKDLPPGQKFGLLTVVEYAGYRESKGAYFLCECVCGKRRPYRGLLLRNGTFTSCGCGLKVRPFHGHAGRTLATASQPYRSWASMLVRVRRAQRGQNKHYQGVQVCARWDCRKGGGFQNFLADLGWPPGPDYSLDRINPFGNYEPGNVRWADKRTQSLNRRKSWLKNGGKPVLVLDKQAQAS